MAAFFKNCVVPPWPVHSTVELVGFVALTAALLTYTWVTLFMLDLLYGAILIVHVWRNRRATKPL